MVAQQTPVESGSDDYGEHIVVEHNGHPVPVPVTGVTKSVYDFCGKNVPDVVDFDHVTIADGTIEAETWIEPNTLVQLTLGETWSCGVIENPEIFPSDNTKAWDRPGSAEKELEQLVEAGLSATEAVDFWMIHYNERSATDWAESRGCTPQAVSENERNARKKLS